MNSQTLIEGFEAGQKGHSGNYFTDGESLYLFHNKIAMHKEGEIYFTLAGYNTSTTKKALNWLSGVDVHSRNGVIKNNGQEIKVDAWYMVGAN